MTEKGVPRKADTDIREVLSHLEELEEAVDDKEEQKEVQKAIRMVEDISLGRVIEKYTTRDMAQAFVGGILLSLPMLVEGGVFEIAEWLTDTTVSGTPVLLILNIAFVIVLTYGLIYWSDIQQVKMKKVLGIFPRRLLGVLAISFLTASFLFFLWGRHTVENPQGYGEVFGRITVVWAAAAIGGALGDILPGESQGDDLNEMLEDILSDGE